VALFRYRLSALLIGVSSQCFLTVTVAVPLTLIEPCTPVARMTAVPVLELVYRPVLLIVPGPLTTLQVKGGCVVKALPN
jgi:hypothetical protein